MSYLINKRGEKIEVNCDSDWLYENVCLVDDDVCLDPVWMVTCIHRDLNGKVDYENYVDKIFTHEPTDEELIHFMISNGFTRYDLVQVEEMKTLDAGWIDDGR